MATITTNTQPLSQTSSSVPSFKESLPTRYTALTVNLNTAKIGATWDPVVFRAFTEVERERKIDPQFLDTLQKYNAFSLKALKRQQP